MPLRLILGPANARKTGWLLDDHARAAGDGLTSWLVVPSSGDAERLQRELSGIGGPPGVPRRAPSPLATVVTTAGFERLLRQRLQLGGRILPKDHRRAVALSAIAAADLELLRPAAQSGWLAASVAGLHDELLAAGMQISEAVAGLRAWSHETRDRRGGELAALLEADERLLSGLRAIGWADRGYATLEIVAALRRGEGDISGLHVAFAGFDDLLPAQRTTILALSAAGADVVLSLPYVEGRTALAGPAGLVGDLTLGGAEQLLLGAEDGSGAGASLLARVERELFEPPIYIAPDPVENHVDGQLAFSDDFLAGATMRTAQGGVTGEERALDSPVDRSVTELRGGGPDEELALIAQHLTAQRQAGIDLGAMAVVVASAPVEGPAIVAALRRAGLPAHLAAERPARTHESVAALRALLRAAGETGTASDLVRWLRGPGGPAEAETLDAMVRRLGARSTRDGLRLWARVARGTRLTELDALRAARDPGALTGAAAAALRTRMTAAVPRGAAPSPGQQRDLRAAGTLLRTLDAIAAFEREAAAQGTQLALTAGDLVQLIDELQVATGPEPSGSIAVVDPLAVRTRHLNVVVLAGAQWGRYPAEEPARVLLSRGDREHLAREHGWPRVYTAEHEAAQRYLTYEIVARPRVSLAVAWHSGDGDGKPAERSMLLDELERIAGGELPCEKLGVGEAAYAALGDDRLARLRTARDGARHSEYTHDHSPLLAAETHEEGHGVRAIQTAARCPAQWLVDHRLSPRALRPDDDPLTAGRMRHDMLRSVIAGALEAGAPPGPGVEDRLREELAAAERRLAEAARASHETVGERMMRERVAAEVGTVLGVLCGDGTTAPAHLPQELEFGFGGNADRGDDARPPVVLERGEEKLTLSGRIDRIDVSDDGEVVVIDYKGASVDQYAQAKWIEGRELQAGLYALVAAKLLGGDARPVASLYQAVPGGKLRGGASKALTGRRLSGRDIIPEDDWERLLNDVVALALDAQRSIDDGIVRPTPDTCSSDGCRYPWLCRGGGR